MRTISPTISMENYLTFEAPEGAKDELIEGEIVISPSGSPRSALVIKRFVRLLDEMLEGADFEVNSDLSIVLDASNPSYHAAAACLCDGPQAVFGCSRM